LKPSKTGPLHTGTDLANIVFR